MASIKPVGVASVGIDVEEIARFKLDRKHHFITSYFTEEECDYAYSRPRPEQHLCGFFCAKEALRKAGIKAPYKEISIGHDVSGKPFVLLLHKAGKAGSKNLNRAKRVSISISHAKGIATAIALIQGE